MKVLLPALAVSVLALLTLWPKLTEVESGFRVGFAKLSTKEVETLAMKNARYFGLNDANRPYAVSADTATQEPGQHDLIHLEAPKADLATASGVNLILDAERGLYDQKMKILDLSGNVSLFHDLGYEMHTESVRIDLARNTARSLDPVTGFGPQGRIESEGFEALEHGKRIIFTGRAHLGLRAAGGPQARRPAPAAGQGAPR